MWGSPKVSPASLFEKFQLENYFLNFGSLDRSSLENQGFCTGIEIMVAGHYNILRVFCNYIDCTAISY